MSGALRLACLLATAGGVGRIPWAPGTVGTALGLLAGIAAIRLLDPSLRLGILLLAGCAAIVASTHAERAIGSTDPSCIIIDEVWAMATVVVTLPWLVSSRLWLALAFGLFRLFDIAKPPPLRLLSRLPGGWGVVADDAGAAAYTVLLLSVLQLLR